MSPKGRHAKAKARITAYESLMNQETKERKESWRYIFHQDQG